jgi:hypothetical protein
VNGDDLSIDHRRFFVEEVAMLTNVINRCLISRLLAGVLLTLLLSMLGWGEAFGYDLLATEKKHTEEHSNLSVLSHLITVKPVEKKGSLVNPGVGYVDFHGKLGTREQSDTAYTPKSGVAYYRWTWADLEPTEGDVNFSLIENALNLASQKNQLFSFRIMTVWQKSTPDWVLNKGVKAVIGFDGQGSIFPDHNSEVYLKYHEDFLRKLGAFFKGRKELYSVDIGSVGCWGEWHSSCCGKISGSECQLLFPTIENQKKIADFYFRFFPGVNLIALINSPLLRDLVRRGSGWRADCLGDYGYFSSVSNHMRDMYEKKILDPDVGSAWKTAPVLFEACHHIDDWAKQGFSTKTILEKALHWHATSINNFSLGVRASNVSDLQNFLDKAAYRFFVKEISFPLSISKFDTFRVETKWVNSGVAPIYSDAAVYFRLRRDDQIFGVWRSSAIPRKWLPGTYVVDDVFDAGSSLTAGRYSLDLSISLFGQSDMRLKLAMENGLADDWYSLGDIFVRTASH